MSASGKTIVWLAMLLGFGSVWPAGAYAQVKKQAIVGFWGDSTDANLKCSFEFTSDGRCIWALRPYSEDAGTFHVLADGRVEVALAHSRTIYDAKIVQGSLDLEDTLGLHTILFKLKRRPPAMKAVPHSWVRAEYEFRELANERDGERADRYREEIKQALEKRLRLLFDAPCRVTFGDLGRVAVTFPQWLDVKGVLAVLGTTGKLQLYWPRNLKTGSPQTRGRRYSGPFLDDQGEYSFADSLDSKLNRHFTKSAPEFWEMVRSWTLLAPETDFKFAVEPSHKSSEVFSVGTTAEGGTVISRWTASRPGEILLALVDGAVVGRVAFSSGFGVSHRFAVKSELRSPAIRLLTNILGCGPLPGGVALLSVSIVPAPKS